MPCRPLLCHLPPHQRSTYPPPVDFFAFFSLSHTKTMAITTKAEAEALTVEELKTELTGRGLPTEGLKGDLLKALLAHIDTAAEINGAATNGTDGKAAEETAKEAAEESAEKPEEEAAAPAAEDTAEKPAEEVVKPAEPAETETATRPVEEVTGGTEEPEAKKAKTIEPESAPEEPKVVAETPAEAAPASEPAATA